MSKADYIIRVEGVNFDDTVYNTTDLSTIRGSSLCLEAFGYELEDALGVGSQSGQNIKTIMKAGAQAFFLLTDMMEAEAAKVEEKVRNTLKEHYRQGSDEPPFADWETLQNWGHLSPEDRLQYLRTPSEHMTFVVARERVEPTNSGLEEDKTPKRREAINRALWRNRRQQMRAPNLPDFEHDHEDLICPIDRNRYVAADATKNGATIVGLEDQFREECRMEVVPDSHGQLWRFKASQRSADLNTYGRDARRTVYAATLGPEALNQLYNRGLFQGFDFVRSFGDLAAEPPDVPVSVRGKLAFLYFDGTGFGNARAETDLGAFSSAVSEITRRMTQRLLNHFMDNADPKAPNAYGYNHRVYRRISQAKYESSVATLLRLETLMSGGEDLSMVVPAWLGWEIAWLMLDWLREAGVDAVDTDKGRRSLHFRAGMLICDSKTPARLATSAAHAICEDAGEAGTSKSEPVLGFHIAEGFDVPEAGGPWRHVVERERQRIYGPDLSEERRRDIDASFRVARSQLGTMEDGIRHLKADFARSQIYRIIEELEPLGDDKSQESRLADLLKVHDFRTGRGMTKDEFVTCLPGLPSIGVLNRITLLAELWDYFEPLADIDDEGDRP